MAQLPKLGLSIWGETIAEVAQVATDAEAAGYESVWTTEFHHTAFVPAAVIGDRTTHVRVGTAIALAFVRSPVITALTALDLDDCTNGRFVLGLGPGVKRLNEDWHHVEYGRPARHIEETVAIIRGFIAAAQTGGDIDYAGEYESARIRGYDRPFARTRATVPIYLGAVGPVMLRTAGRIADGWISHELNSARYLREKALPQLERGMHEARRNRTDLEIVASVTCMIDADGHVARRWAARLVAFHASVKSYEDFFDFHGFGEEAREVRRHFIAGDVEAMVAAVPDAMVDALTLSGAPDEVHERLSEYAGLADVLKLSVPMHLMPLEVTREAQQALLELGRDATGARSGLARGLRLDRG